MFFYILFLMWYFDTWTKGTYLYLALHGSYGFFWVMKDYTFPDPGFARKVTLVSWLMPWPVALIPYMFIPYWMVTEDPHVSDERMLLAIFLYVNGIVLMMLTDAAKYYVLRERKGLITHKMHGWSRNMNYVGEIMLYASFGVLCQKWEVWAIFAYVWCLIFPLRMSCKDYSLSKKEGWDRYSKDTWLFVPKICNSAQTSAIVYGAALLVILFISQHGGLKMAVEALF
jgi:protein-S-isoprenylcysteine O-methyltransferase Ste14